MRMCDSSQTNLSFFANGDISVKDVKKTIHVNPVL